MKNLRLGLILYFLIPVFVHTNASIASVAVMTGEEEKTYGRGVLRLPAADLVIEGAASPTKRTPALSRSEADKISGLVSYYQSQGMTNVAAMVKAMKEVKALKETPLEKELRELGCVQWGEIKELTRDIVDEVKLFYNPTRGLFILKPGLQIVYENEVS